MTAVLSPTQQGQRTTVTQKDFVMSQVESQDFHATVIAGIINQVLKNQRELPALRDRIAKFSRLAMTKKIVVLPAPFYYPAEDGSWNKNMLAYTDFDRKAGKVRVSLFIPALKDAQRRKPLDFFYEAAVCLAHEVIHIENQPEFPYPPPTRRSLQQHALSEAITKGKEILEIIRPLLRRKTPLPERFADESKLLSLCKDDIRSKCWVDKFLSYPR